MQNIVDKFLRPHYTNSLYVKTNSSSLLKIFHGRFISNNPSMFGKTICWPLNVGKKKHVNNTLMTVKMWPWPLNRGSHWIEVSNAAVYWQKIGTLESGCLIVGGRLVEVRLYYWRKRKLTQTYKFKYISFSFKYIIFNFNKHKTVICFICLYMLWFNFIIGSMFVFLSLLGPRDERLITGPVPLDQGCQ